MGNSDGFTFDKALFKAHPEFQGGRVAAHVIAPGQMLVSVDVPVDLAPEVEGHDPVLAAYLGFLDGQLEARRDLLRPFTAEDMAGVDALLEGVEVDLDAPLEGAEDFELP
ncbi:hypothetical protein [Roseisolibacter agri]|uniref:hypothetical protein n=1 Tax=Roseisolibacter agri TaxID=2014610 RepID=UPI0024E155E1|nr:hypothetical protein [Roseisolibacter agri]